MRPCHPFIHFFASEIRKDIVNIAEAFSCDYFGAGSNNSSNDNNTCSHINSLLIKSDLGLCQFDHINQIIT